jgi:succinate dehydrogenase / fumarate reductase cytochrome b subunit
MADVTRQERPLSPHLTIYRPQINSAMSIFHRFTGLGLALSGVLVVWWFLAAASSPEYFAFADGLLTSWIGTLVMLVSLLALWYHFFNGIRHLVWDTGASLEIERINSSSIAVLAAAAVMTVLTLVIAF